MRASAEKSSDAVTVIQPAVWTVPGVVDDGSVRSGLMSSRRTKNC